MFICGMVLRCDGTLKPGLSLDRLQQIWQPLSYIALNCWYTTLNPITHSPNCVWHKWNYHLLIWKSCTCFSFQFFRFLYFYGTFPFRAHQALTMQQLRWLPPLQSSADFSHGCHIVLEYHRNLIKIQLFIILSFCYRMKIWQRPIVGHDDLYR